MFSRNGRGGYSTGGSGGATISGGIPGGGGAGGVGVGVGGGTGAAGQVRIIEYY